jgi:transposase
MLRGLIESDSVTPAVRLEVEMAGLFWLSDSQWAVMEPFMPKNQPGARRVDDRRTISGIVHVIRSGCRWQDCPRDYGPPTTVYNRFNRWSRRGFWRGMLSALAEAGWVAESASLDSTYIKAHRSAHGGKGGRRRRPSVSREAGRPPKSTSSPTSLAGRRSSTSPRATPAM